MFSKGFDEHLNSWTKQYGPGTLGSLFLKAKTDSWYARYTPGGLPKDYEPCLTEAEAITLIRFTEILKMHCNMEALQHSMRMDDYSDCSSEHTLYDENPQQHSRKSEPQTIEELWDCYARPRYGHYIRGGYVYYGYYYPLALDAVTIGQQWITQFMAMMGEWLYGY
ncbi:hypothetical protein HDU96_009170 [Phlyctochytrium bullatum]|nr:hypothetical protein HDU96_009170 [Phlyctochytrium bullatum]